MALAVNPSQRPVVGAVYAACFVQMAFPSRCLALLSVKSVKFETGFRLMECLPPFCVGEGTCCYFVAPIVTQVLKLGLESSDTPQDLLLAERNIFRSVITEIKKCCKICRVFLCVGYVQKKAPMLPI